MTRKPLYIEIKINCDLETIWEKTQNPNLHQQWDLRFTDIKYLPKSTSDEPQKFLYVTRIGFGIQINGVGESVATKIKESGVSTSVLKFSSDSNYSIIKQGSGYWKYSPQSDGIIFLTGYDYETRWGYVGKGIDYLIFRPLMIWATAWSFDCLKNWIENDINPKQAIKSQLTVWLTSFTLGLIWIYQGLIPKILFPDSGELTILRQSGLFNGFEENLLSLIGIGEIVFGLMLVLLPKIFMQYLNITALILLAGGAFFSNPRIFVYPFNPFSLNLSMIALSVIIIIHIKNLPKATNCITRQKK